MTVRALVISLSIAIGLAGASYYAFDNFLHSPLNKKQGVNAALIYTLAPGTNPKTMLQQLASQGMISRFQAQLIYGWIRFKQTQRLFKAGEYSLPFTLTPYELVEKFIKGDVIVYKLTFLEGSTFNEMFKTVVEHPAIKKTLSSHSWQELMQQLGTERLPEGLFFPDTYYFTAQITDIGLLRICYQTMKQKLDVAWANRQPNLLLKTPYEALILASIIEKEAATKEERYLISGVFQARLAKKMRLQADPTVLYGLNKSYKEPITKQDLNQDTPYNTYLHQGLPPTPICLPGWEALDAALHPIIGEALYFVSKGDGSHYFSASLKEHQEAVETYQRNPTKNSEEKIR